MVAERDQRAVEEEVRVLGCRAAHDQQPGKRRRPCHARQALERAQRVAAGARDAVDFAAVDRTPRDFTRWAFAFDHDLEAGGFRRNSVDEVGGFAGNHVFLARELAKARGGDAHADSPGAHVVETKAAFAVGQNPAFPAIGQGDGDLDPGQRFIVPTDLERAAELARGGGRRLRGHRRHGLQRERVPVQDLSRDGLAASRRWPELELERRLARRFVEAVAGGLVDFRSGDVALSVDRQLEHDVALEPCLLCCWWIRRVLELGERRRDDLQLFRRRGFGRLAHDRAGPVPGNRTFAFGLGSSLAPESQKAEQRRIRDRATQRTHCLSS